MAEPIKWPENFFPVETIQQGRKCQEPHSNPPKGCTAMTWPCGCEWVALPIEATNALKSE